MVKCSAPLCRNASYQKTPQITFHRFPQVETLKNAWLKNMKRINWQPKTSSVLCSKHFEAHLVDRSGFRTVLTPNAIPTIFKKLPGQSSPSRNEISIPSSTQDDIRVLKKIIYQQQQLTRKLKRSLQEQKRIAARTGRELKNIKKQQFYEASMKHAETEDINDDLEIKVKSEEEDIDIDEDGWKMQILENKNDTILETKALS